jgi:phosphotransferase system enzyme I (PtsI)
LNGNEMPDENEQEAAYQRVAKAVDGEIVIIRTLDAGGDKLPIEPLTEPEPNPFLGWRGIRVSLSRPAMFRDQLRAILRASAHGKLAVMFPLVSGLSELLRAREMLNRCMDELSSEGIAFNEKIPVGVMIEVPSAAVCADLLAPHVDFFSIGTNDLIQYTVAVDRVNPHVADLYRPTHPAVIRLIKRTVEAGESQGIWTGVCGEMAGDIRLTPLLLGLGVEELSVSPKILPKVGQVIRSLNYGQCHALAEEVLRESRSQRILDMSLELARQCYPDLMD